MSWPAAVGERAILSPAGHAAVDELCIARQADVRPQPQPLHDAGAKALDQRVGLVDETQRSGAAFGALDVQPHGAAPAAGHVERAEVEQAQRPAHGGLALDAHDLGAHVGKEHGGKGAGTDAGEFDDFQAVKGSHQCFLHGRSDGQKLFKGREYHRQIR